METFSSAAAGAKYGKAFFDMDGFGDSQVLPAEKGNEKGGALYTGGAFSAIGAFAVGRNLSTGEREERVRVFKTELASISHSVGELEAARVGWEWLLEQRLEKVEYEGWVRPSGSPVEDSAPVVTVAAAETELEASAAVEASKTETDTGADSPTVALVADARATKAHQHDAQYPAITKPLLLRRLCRDGGIPVDKSADEAKPALTETEKAEVNEGHHFKKLTSLTTAMLCHVALTYQCLGRFELAKPILHSPGILQNEYARMLKLVAKADEFRRQHLLSSCVGAWQVLIKDTVRRRALLQSLSCLRSFACSHIAIFSFFASLLPVAVETPARREALHAAATPTRVSLIF